MPFVLEVDKVSDCLLAQWSGPFSRKDNISYTKALSKLTAAELALPRLHDVREVIFDVETQEIYRTRKSNGKDNSEQSPKLRSAVLVNSDLEFGMMRIFAAVYNDPKLDVQIFRELEKAKEWLGVNQPGDPFKNMTAL